MPNVRSIVAALAFMTAAPAFAFADDVPIMVTFHGDPDETVIEQAGGKVKLKVHGIKMLSADVKASKIAEIAANPAVAGVFEDGEATIAVAKEGKPSGGGQTPTQPTQTAPWGIGRVDAPDTWTKTNNRGSGIVVAIVDTGIDYLHPDLGNRVPENRRKSYVDNTTAMDNNGHGTHCAGIVGASNNTIGTIGVAPEVTFAAVKVLNRRGSGSWSWVASGIDWARANGAGVISLSLGGQLSDPDANPVKSAVELAVASNVVVVAAGGNEGPTVNPISYPGAYAACIAVAATDSADKVASFSTRGDYIDIAAPGVGVYSTYKGGGYATMSGTSMATPHVAGAAALVLAKGFLPSEVRGRLQSKADELPSTPPGKDSLIGDGLLDVEESVTGETSAP